ncbi:MAG TPA: AAA family ATPase [Flavitalea sp.]|nr:AAA family ATPase [Flavitalea sp.]
MTFIERDGFIASLQTLFDKVGNAEGHCVLVCGEAGIGKTALVKTFCKKQGNDCNIYHGNCDDLFTPRPLAPLYDVLWQVNKERWPVPPSNEERSVLFANFFQELSSRKGKLLIVFEDIHWADEGTLDFIKFFVRRIEQLPCLFILTYRDDELYSRHPLRNVIGNLPADSFTRLTLAPLSKSAVVELARQKGYSGEDVYNISGGNPFYVNEILASYSPGVPDNIKDSILAVYERQEEGTKNAWEIFSVIPEGLEVDRFSKIRASFNEEITHCFAINVLTVQNEKVVFKHELYRRTIEESLLPFKRVELNKKMLDLFLDSFIEKGEIERILHYAKHANEKDLVVKYAPEAASKAAARGAHLEASKLFHTAIQYCEGNDNSQLTQLYDAYAFECYLSNQVPEAITYTEKVLKLRRAGNDIEKTGDTLRFLSRLWWFNGNRKHAEQFASEAIELLKDRSASATKAMAYSNMSQLKMLSDEPGECIAWGQKAIDMAVELGNDEILCHAQNNVGTVQMFTTSTEKEGIGLLQQSLDMALKHGFHEHAARAYTNLASGSVKIRNFQLAAKSLESGIAYCERRDLHSWTNYMLSWKAKLDLERGVWADARELASNLLKNEHQPAIIKLTALLVLAKIHMRRGDQDPLPMLFEARKIACETMELQRIIPAIVGLLEYEWLTGKVVIEQTDIQNTKDAMLRAGIDWDKNEFAWWMAKAGRQIPQPEVVIQAYDTGSSVRAARAAAIWEKIGSPYEQALALFEGREEDKRAAITIVQDLGATAVNEKLKQEMRNLGIRNIPRGIRNSTRSNAAFLTGREMEILQLLKGDLHNKEIAAQLFISAKTVDHHISSILFKLDTNSRSKAVTEAVRMGILK